ncbi:hypothetical protein [Acinetobacter sp. YH12023]|uniref:hypothetical protein n=1 Tax=Acinetobacter sp. YH12023 TaxID=2601041 RepID=UPI0015D3C140|nr:hypothetical protein [Acinetobacter sp. YH12023]
MDIKKEREVFEKYCFEVFLMSPSDGHFDRELQDPEFYESVDTHRLWKLWQAKAHAVPEWIDYTKQSPRIDGRYQIFISGEQITADWQSPFGFSDPVEGEALIQELISHWGMLPEPPKTQEPTND